MNNKKTSARVRVVLVIEGERVNNGQQRSERGVCDMAEHCL